MKQSKAILQAEEKMQRGKMTMLQFRQITTLADNLSKFDEAIKWMEYPDITKTEKEAEVYIETLCEELDNDYDENDPESWDCDEDEYADRYSHLANKAHEASEGMER